MKNRELNVLTDEAIVKMAQEGSGTAYEYLIEKYRDVAKIKAKKYYIAGGDNEDVVQEGMIGIFKAVRDFDADKDASFRTFVDLCISRQIVNAIKGANRQKHQILNESVSLTSHEGADTEGGSIPAGSIVSNSPEADPEAMMLVREVVDYLIANDEHIFSPMESKVWKEMRRGKSRREIAKALERTDKTIDNAVHRIKKKIERQLKP